VATNNPLNIGIIGCGNILPAYVKGCAQFDILNLVACADIDQMKADAAAEKFGIKAVSVDALLADPSIDLVINLTIPAAHAEVSLAAIAAGKHIHSEKPLAITREDGQTILEVAKEKGVRVSCAPDTFLGGGLQTARKLIEEGDIGRPVAAVAFMTGHGPEHWHPNPDFFYEVGAGPVFDMGPYYLTALVHLLGPVKRVTASTSIAFPEREITNPNNRTGEKIPVHAPTHTTGILDHESGATATLIFSWDVWKTNLPLIEIYGTEGSLIVPDPNTFKGPVKIQKGRDGEWEEVEIVYPEDIYRSIGAADMAHAIQSGRSHRSSGDLAYHVLDLMHALNDASDSGKHVMVESGCEQPALLPEGLSPGLLDD
jgi:predicted dehydrogenase